MDRYNAGEFNIRLMLSDSSSLDIEASKERGELEEISHWANRLVGYPFVIVDKVDGRLAAVMSKDVVSLSAVKRFIPT